MDCAAPTETTGHQRGFGEIFLSYWPRQEAKAWPGLPALASPTLDPHSPELPAEDLPALKAQYSPWLGAPGCCGPQSGWNHYGYFEFCLQLEFYLNKLHDEVLEIFFAGNTKENCKSLKPVSVHYRNEA